MALLAVPLIVIVGVLGLLLVTLGGGAAPANQQADQEQRAAAAAKAAQACAAPGAAASTSGSSAAVSAPPGPVDKALVAAQGVELNDAQILTAQTIVAEGTGQDLSERAVASALLAAFGASKFDPNGRNGLFGLTAAKSAGTHQSVPSAAADFYTALRREGRVDNAAVALAEVTARAGGGGMEATVLQPFSAWALNLAGYLSTGHSTVVLSGGKVNCAPAELATPGPVGTWDPGFIIADDVFYNPKAMTEQQLRAWIAKMGPGCTDAECLPRLLRDVDNQPTDAYCQAVQGGNGLDAAAIIYRVSVACGVNPQVMVVTLEKESSGVTASTRRLEQWDAAWGWHCPDSGPGGTANCDPAYGGFFNQAFGMAKQWRRYVVDADKYTYRAGQTVSILWNVEASGCGGAPVTIRNKATAALYNYTPYQPNPASLAAYPVEGDQCSAYGNRNFFFIFGKWFGPTGGPQAPTGTVVGGKGLQIPLPAGYPVQGVVQAPSANAATVIRSALSQLGLPYVWAGGDANGPTVGDNETGEIGFDCSGLMIYAYARIGVQLPHYSGAQSQSGASRPFQDARPGDLLFWGGIQIHHVAMYLGVVNGVPYMVEAPQRGVPVRVSPVRVAKSDWNGVAVTPAGSAGITDREGHR
jgi:cell wall-associated NlpC family hydrolase